MDNRVQVKFYKVNGNAYIDFIDLSNFEKIRTQNLLDPNDYDVLSNKEKEAFYKALNILGIKKENQDSKARELYEQPTNVRTMRAELIADKNNFEIAVIDYLGKRINIEVGTLKEINNA